MRISRQFRKHGAYWKKRRRKAVRWFAVLMLLAVSGITGFIFASNEPRIVETTPSPAGAPVGADDSKVAKGASVEWDYEYKMCGHSVYISCKADEDIVGLTFSQMQAEFPDARIISFEPERIVLKMSFDSYCPKHYILKRYRDMLAAFRTIPGSDEKEIYREIPVRFNDLNADEQEVLETGKVFESFAGLEYYIENIENPEF